MSSVKYRSDIDGLRAVAVISVVLFHINKSWLPGGFVGVDIFFVISGYLITKIIYQDMTAGSFSYASFYKRRIKRILPVFFTVVIIVTVASSLVMLPADFLYYMKTVGSTLIFSSNMYFGYGVDYFSPNTDEYPLLHTWSLAVEEQYYILFPTFLILLMKILKGKRGLVNAMILLCVFSVAISCSLHLFPSWVKYNYYWLPSRAYELMIGSVTAIAVRKAEAIESNGSVFSAIGAAMIAISLTFISESPGFPGFFAIIPCVGTALILASGGREAGFINKILSFKPVVMVGLISYSLYLWHWPVLSLMRYISNDGSLTPIQIVIAIVVMFVLSYLSWMFIENPVRKSNYGLLRSFVIFFICPSLILGFFVYGSIKSEGYPQRFGVNTKQMVLESTYMTTPFCHNTEIGNCIFGDKSKKPDTYMMGDSHAGHYSPMLDEVGKKLGFSFVAKTVDACYPLIDVNGQFPSKKEPFYTYLCPQLIRKASVEYKSYKNIIFAGVWSEHFRIHPEAESWLENQVSTLTSEGHNVFLMAQVPTFKPGVYEHAFRQRFSIFDFSKITGNSSDLTTMRDGTDKNANKILKDIASKYKNAYFVDPISELGSSR